MLSVEKDLSFEKSLTNSTSTTSGLTEALLSNITYLPECQLTDGKNSGMVIKDKPSTSKQNNCVSKRILVKTYNSLSLK